MPGPKSFKRTDRVSAQLRREIGTLVHEAVREHGLPSVSVSDVEVTRDMAHAKVFVTALESERSAEAVKGLKELAREFRFRLGRMLRMRHVPELHFHYDESVDRGEQIETLLRESGITETVAAERRAEAADDQAGDQEGDQPEGRPDGDDARG
jgi:ribosome-binding factor A